MEQQTHDTGDLTLNYVEVGQGDPLVLLHGFTGNWRSWSQEIGLLSHRWHVLAPDARGHGDSSRSEDAKYGYGVRTADAASFIEGVVGGPAVVAGHSMGGATAMGIAALHPELVRAIVLEDPHVSHGYVGTEEGRASTKRSRDRLRSTARFDEMVAAVQNEDPEMDASAARWSVTQGLKLDPDTFNPFIESAMFDDFDPDSVLSKIECPVLLMQADPEQGGVVTDEAADRLRTAIPDCRHVRFPGVGHRVHKDAPIKFRRVLFDFLDTI